jgi:hypothetical protein
MAHPSINQLQTLLQSRLFILKVMSLKFHLPASMLPTSLFNLYMHFVQSNKHDRRTYFLPISCRCRAIFLRQKRGYILTFGARTNV